MTDEAGTTTWTNWGSGGAGGGSGIGGAGGIVASGRAVETGAGDSIGAEARSDDGADGAGRSRAGVRSAARGFRVSVAGLAEGRAGGVDGLSTFASAAGAAGAGTADGAGVTIASVSATGVAAGVESADWTTGVAAGSGAS
jgi:hypothetical protein